MARSSSGPELARTPASCRRRGRALRSRQEADERECSDLRSALCLVDETKLGSELDVAETVLRRLAAAEGKPGRHDRVKLEPRERAVVDLEMGEGAVRRVASHRPLRGGVELPVPELHRLRIVGQKGWTGPAGTLGRHADRPRVIAKAVARVTRCNPRRSCAAHQAIGGDQLCAWWDRFRLHGHVGSADGLLDSPAHVAGDLDAVGAGFEEDVRGDDRGVLDD